MCVFMYVCMFICDLFPLTLSFPFALFSLSVFLSLSRANKFTHAEKLLSSRTFHIREPRTVATPGLFICPTIYLHFYIRYFSYARR